MGACPPGLVICSFLNGQGEMGEMSRGEKIIKWVRENPSDYFKCLIFINVLKLLAADWLEEVDFFGMAL